MSIKILITGGSGYIGSHTIISLLDKGGYDVISVDNYSNSSAATYDRIEQITGKRVPFIKADISVKSECDAVFKQFPGIESCIHFAAFKSVPESVAHPGMYYRNNLNSLLNILESGRENGLNNFIFSSSCSVYGNISDLPVSETTPLQQIESPYAFTKLAGEKIVKDIVAANPGFRAVSLRYFNPVGAHASGLIGELPNQRPNNLVPVITQTAIGKMKTMSVFGSDYTTRDGTCVRDYVHVCDIAEAHVAALEYICKTNSAQAYDLFNLGTGKGVTVLEAIHAFEKVSGRKLSYTISDRRQGDVAAIYSDSAKAKTMLNWSAQRNLEEMMSSAWKWEQHLAQSNQS